MSLQEVWQIKTEQSKITKDMTTAELKKYYANALCEFNKIMGNRRADD